MSAIADLIYKVLWQCTVYFQDLDLRPEAQGWDTVYPASTHTNVITQHTYEHIQTFMCASPKGRPVKAVVYIKLYIFITVNKYFSKISVPTNCLSAHAHMDM